MWGLVGAGIAVVTVGALHVVAADTVDPIRRAISEYAVGTYGLLFGIGVLALTAGAALVLVAVLRAGVARVVSSATLLYPTWTGSR